jgi:biopolymer transport protein ExbB
VNPAELILTLGMAGGDWVLYLLLVLSMLSVTLILERALYFALNREPFGTILSDGIQAIAEQDLAKASTNDKGPVGRLFGVAAQNWSTSRPRLQAALMAHRLRERASAERGLVLLGTLGNNAPFIGLFGTVLGIIRAFKDLGAANSVGPSVVMTGISEALVATAVGILVAIPAVVAYNLCQRSIRVMDYRLDEAAEAILAVAAETPALPGAKEPLSGRV